MPVPDYGAAPLAKTFMLMRGLSGVAMIAIVGMTANFVAQIVSTNVDPPREVVATLSIVSFVPLTQRYKHTLTGAPRLASPHSTVSSASRSSTPARI